MEKNMVQGSSRTKALVLNGMIAALYVALSVMVSPIASGPVQFRISESLNHLVVFNKKMLWGIFTGVLIFNFFWGAGILDVLFGGGQTLLCLLIVAGSHKFLPDVRKRLILNVVLFTVSMALIAWMIVLTSDTPLAFWPIYASTAASEFCMLAVSAPVMYLIDKALHFEAQI